MQNIYTDPLTSVNNLIKLQFDLDKKNKKITLILFDIKSFSKLNKTYGTNVSNFILKEFTKNVNKVLNQNGLLYRLYFDQFAVRYESEIRKKDIELFLKMIKEFSYSYKNSEFTLDITMGYSRGNNTKVFENSTIALKEAKTKKVNIYEFNEIMSIDDEDDNHILWLNKLNKALVENQVVPYFMPMYNTNTKKIVKYETLVRIVDGDNIYTPDKFLDISISSGKYHKITQIMIEKSFLYFKEISSIQFSINLSLRDILNPETMKILFTNLDNYSYSSNVIIEILESEEISDFELLNNFIKRVKSFGGKVAIDDFGSGYSNFNYIMNLDIDIVKLDSCLIENILTDQHSVVIVSNIVKIIKELNLEVVAENVFSEEIADLLISLDVDSLQGFYIGKANKDILK
jgi:EAL domain-containing protein (putative c-di-GMP-specific phosphodiesterase class I)/GGDEF domain-containing protein